MKYLFTVLISCAISVSGFAQSYQWVLKRSGSSLGGPIDYNQFNHSIVYYGTGNIVYKSTDAGETFFQAGTNIPYSSEVKCVLVDDYNPGTLLVAVESSPNDKIYKTTNDGSTWTLTLDEGQMSYFGIPVTQDPTHPNDIYTMTSSNFKKSTDFGSTWTTISSNFGTSGSPCDIEVFPDTSIILIGDAGTGIFKSTDYGLSWSQKYSTSGEIPTITVDFTHPGITWATKWSGGGGLLKSTDYGETWNLQSGFSGISMWGVYVQPTDGNIVIANSYSTPPGSWRSINGGQTWTAISIPSAGYQVVSVDSMTQYAAQSGGFYKLDAPWFVPVELTNYTASLINKDIILNWTTATEINNKGFEIEQSFDKLNFNTIGFVPGFGTTTESKSYSFKISGAPSGAQYYRLKQIDLDGTFKHYNSIEVDVPVIKEFALYQNHPNPFNPSTTISYSLPVESNVSIKLFNILGQQVATITNSDFQAGNQKIEFNAQDLSSGTYIYTLEARGTDGRNFISTKKMILLK
jgi:hypothetical protein